MDSFQTSEALALWQDLIDLLEGEQVSQSLLAMVKSCEVVDLSPTTLTISTSARFVQRTLLNDRKQIEEVLSKAAFTPLSLEIKLVSQQNTPHVPQDNTVSRGEFEELQHQLHAPQTTTEIQGSASTGVIEEPPHKQRNNPLMLRPTENDSRLTFERFVQGNENSIALSAAKQVADGINKTYNPLFIYGKSGLGKTHLLKAIQNYIFQNDQDRICVYRTSRDFMSDYVNAMHNTERSVRDEFERNYNGIDILIIDDIQYLKPTGATIEFFFDTFNYLSNHGKQIVIASDRSPHELGLGAHGFDERITSRFDSGFTCTIGAPEYELKVALVRVFYERMRNDAARENISNLDGTLSDEDLELMAERAGNNIRVIESFVQACLMRASLIERTQKRHIRREELINEATRRWPDGQRTITVEAIQRTIENEYDISHIDLIGDKRNKELMTPRHIAIWLARELTDTTLADIGDRFGGRSHATVKHSISWVDKHRKSDRSLNEHLNKLKDALKNS